MGFWKKLAKIGTFAAPLIAAPFTGGASLAMIGAGAGAANAALDKKGLKGMALGAGLGAIPGIGKAAMAGKAASSVGGNVGKLGKVGSALGMFGGGGAGDQGPIPTSMGGIVGNKGGGLTGFLGKLKSAGIDPTALGLGALSLLGDDKEPGERTSFKGSGPLTDPISSLGMSQDLALQMGKALSGSRPQLRQIPGLSAPVDDPIGPLLSGMFDKYMPKPASSDEQLTQPGGGAMSNAASKAARRKP